MSAHTVSAPIGTSFDSKAERRLQALLALFRGEPMAQVAVRSGICRSDLYKFRPYACPPRFCNWHAHLSAASPTSVLNA